MIHHHHRVCQLLSTAPPSDEATALALAARIAILRAGASHGIDEQQAAALFAEGRDLAETTGDKVKLVQLLYEYGRTCVYAGDATHGATLLAEAAGLARENGDDTLYATVRTAEAWANLSLGKLRTAFEMNLELLDKCGKASWLGFMIGFHLHTARDLLLEHAQLSLAPDEEELWELLGHSPATGHLPHFRTAKALACGQWEAASRLIAQARELAQARRDMNLEVSTLHTEADMFMRQERFDQARGLLERALTMARAARTTLNLEALAVIPLARAYAGLQQWDRARATARAAIEATQQRKARHHEALARTAAAEIAIDSGVPDAAQQATAHLERAAVLIEATEARAYLGWLHEAQAKLLRLQGDAAGARTELLQAEHWHRRRDDIFHAERVARIIAGLPAI